MKGKTALVLTALILMAVLSLAPGAIHAGEPPSGEGFYIVQEGDTLSALALRFGTTVSALAEANGIADPDLIYVGQGLVIPGSSGGEGFYTVQQGDTLSALALCFGTTVSALAEANGIADPDLIYVGQGLVIPGSSAIYATSSASSNLIANGNFEAGFGPDGVGLGWHRFDNGGLATYVFWDDVWDPVVFEGEHSQGIEICALGQDSTDPDRYAGIYQTVNVVPDTTYQFTMRGMIRSTVGGPHASGYEYRMQVGFDFSGGINPWAPSVVWTDVNLPHYPRTAPGPFGEFHTTITATGEQLTIFIRGWKKWSTGGWEADFNIDDISLVEVALANRNMEYIVNGDFEGGFHAGLALGWSAFDNGGLADYVWWDDTWDPVVFDGEHSQGIEISTLSQAGSDPDRYAGIYQRITGLIPGETYHFIMHGKIRSTEGSSKASSWGYRVQVGWDPTGGTDWTAVTNWVDVGWEEQPRYSPDNMEVYETDIVAPPSGTMTLFIRVWKKWATGRREVDVNLDAISLKGPALDPPARLPVTGLALSKAALAASVLIIGLIKKLRS